MHTVCINIGYGKASLAQKARPFFGQFQWKGCSRPCKHGKIRNDHFHALWWQVESSVPITGTGRLDEQVRETSEEVSALKHAVLRYPRLVAQGVQERPAAVLSMNKTGSRFNASAETIACDLISLIHHALKEVRRIATPSCRSLSGKDPEKLP